MDQSESIPLTANELINVASEETPIREICHNGTFGNERGYIFLWRENSQIRYNLGGKVYISSLPESNEFEMYHEVGSVSDLRDALHLVMAWLIEGTEVPQLPPREITQTSKN